mmetsp:Transcript_39635/g.128345  ORF Transcript_39635/g.128345 Transcript_39635/m.128345 type:complete len:238 (-) Transcript_39635:156-869(-)
MRARSVRLACSSRRACGPSLCAPSETHSPFSNCGRGASSMTHVRDPPPGSVSTTSRTPPGTTRQMRLALREPLCRAAAATSAAASAARRKASSSASSRRGAEALAEEPVPPTGTAAGELMRAVLALAGPGSAFANAAAAAGAVAAAVEAAAEAEADAADAADALSLSSGPLLSPSASSSTAAPPSDDTAADTRWRGWCRHTVEWLMPGSSNGPAASMTRMNGSSCGTWGRCSRERVV